MEFGMLSDQCEKMLIRGVKSHFGQSASAIMVSETTDNPYLQLKVELSLYNFVQLRIFVEKRTIFYSINQSGVQFPLFKIELNQKLFIDSLPDLEKEVRLRIPDKYLKAKGY